MVKKIEKMLDELDSIAVSQSVKSTAQESSASILIGADITMPEVHAKDNTNVNDINMDNRIIEGTDDNNVNAHETTAASTSRTANDSDAMEIDDKEIKNQQSLSSSNFSSYKGISPIAEKHHAELSPSSHYSRSNSSASSKRSYRATTIQEVRDDSDIEDDNDDNDDGFVNIKSPHSSSTNSSHSSL